MDGTNGISSFTNTIESFVMPASAANVTVDVVGSTAFAIGMYVWVEVAGEMKVISKPDSVSLQLQNTGWAGNSAAAAVIPAGVQISPTGKSAGAP